MAKAKIQISKDSKKHPVYNKFGSGDPPELECLFNPQQYSLNTKANYGESKGKSSTKKEQQFIDRDADTLSVELFFDTSREKTDVRKNYTEHIDLLMKADESKENAPPIVKFVWGSFTFKSVVKSANKTFTRFLTDGTPVRAKVSMEFQQHGKDKSDKKKKEGGGGGKAKTYTFKKGDTLWELAGDEYGDPTKWHKIADENNIDDPRSIPVGKTVTIPPE